MKLEREVITEIRGEWILSFALMGSSVRWPVFKTIQGVLSFIFLALAYNIGVWDAQEYLKWTAYFSAQNTITDYQTCQALTYYPTKEGNAVVWKVETRNLTDCHVGQKSELTLPFSKT